MFTHPVSMRCADIARQLNADNPLLRGYPAPMTEATPAQQLGARIKRAREAAGMTQPVMAAKLAEKGHNVDAKQTVSTWETGRNTPSALVIRDIARVCGISTDDLLFGEGDEKPTKRVDILANQSANIAKLNARRIERLRKIVADQIADWLDEEQDAPPPRRELDQAA